MQKFRVHQRSGKGETIGEIISLGRSYNLNSLSVSLGNSFLFWEWPEHKKQLLANELAMGRKFGYVNTEEHQTAHKERDKTKDQIINTRRNSTMQAIRSGTQGFISVASWLLISCKRNAVISWYPIIPWDDELPTQSTEECGPTTYPEIHFQQRQEHSNALHKVLVRPCLEHCA